MRLCKLALAAAVALAAVACNNDAARTNQPANANTTAGRPAAGPSPAAATPTPDELAAARGLYAQHCQRCHQPDGGGGVFEEQGLKPLRVPTLRAGSAGRHSDQELTHIITNGHDSMPAFKDKLTPEQVGQVLALIRRDFQRRAATPAAPGQPVSAH